MSSYIESLFSLKGKTAAVTGCTRGIGQAIALALGKAGADIVLLQRDTSNRETADLLEKEGRRAVIVKCDLSSKEECSKLAAHVTGPKDQGGLGETVDILVNCGGIQRRHPAENFPDSDWSEVLQVNLESVWTLSRDFGRHMLESRGGVTGGAPVPENAVESNPRGNGKIINISSLVSFQGGITVPAYAAAKHGVLGTKALSNDWAKKGINVNAVAPGYIATEMNTALLNNPERQRQIFERIPVGRWGLPKDFEGTVIFLASKASDYICGENITVDGGWMAR